MPNWCNNNLKITGPEEELYKFKGKLRITKDDDGTEKIPHLFNTFFPMPKELEIKHSGESFSDFAKAATDQKQKDGMPDWYEWRCENWGTKWDAMAIIRKYELNTIDLEYETAWCPALDWHDKVASEYPKLRFFIFGESIEGDFNVMRAYYDGYCYHRYYEEGIITNSWPELDEKVYGSDPFPKLMSVRMSPVDDAPPFPDKSELGPGWKMPEVSDA